MNRFGCLQYQASKLGTTAAQIIGTWTTQNNILSDTDANASATIAIAAKNTTDTLEVQNFGFDSAIPAGATIRKVQLSVNWKVSSTAGIANLDAFWRVVTTNGTTHTNSAEPIAFTNNIYDVTSERSWTRADLLNGTFVVRVNARSGNNATSVTYSFDWVRVIVDFTLPVPIFSIQAEPQPTRSRTRIIVAPVEEIQLSTAAIVTITKQRVRVDIRRPIIVTPTVLPEIPVVIPVVVYGRYKKLPILYATKIIIVAVPVLPPGESPSPVIYAYSSN